MAEHKHAEVLRAIADGKDVQWQYKSDSADSWNDYDDCNAATGFNPIIDFSVRWRVKPEPKPDYVRHIGFDRNGDASTQRDGIPTFLTKDAWEYVVNITFDGETNEPKSVELAK